MNRLEAAMNRYADPERCPDCRAPIALGAERCLACGLILRGDVAGRLFLALSSADQLLAALRSQSEPTAAIAVDPHSGRAGVEATAGNPRSGRVGAERSGLSAASVPKILLALGAGCLLVAALVFLAVTWSVLGVAGRTATLVAFTAIAGGLAGWMAGRGLRGAAEALSLVGFGLLAMDALGARTSGWFGDVSDAGFLLGLGLLLALAGGAAAVAVRRTAAGALTGAEVVVAVGAGLFALGLVVNDLLSTSTGLVAAVLAAAVATAAAHRVSLSGARAGCALVTALAWAELSAVGVVRAVQHSTAHELWADLHAWPLLVAAGLVGSVAALRALRTPVRVGAVAVAEALVALVVALPLRHVSDTEATLGLLGVLAAAGVLTWLLPRPWAFTGLLTQVVAGTMVGAVAGAHAAQALRRLGELASAPWAGHVSDRLNPVAGLPAPWLLPFCVVAVLGTVLVVAHAEPRLAGVVASVLDLRFVAALVPVVGTALVLLHPVPVWLATAVPLASAAGLLGWWLVRDDGFVLGTAAALVVPATAVGLTAQALTAAVAGVILVGASVVLLRARSVELAAGAGAVAAAALAGSVWTWGALLGAEPVWAALAALLLLAGAAFADTARSWLTVRAPAARALGVEVGAAAAAVPVALAGVLLAPESEHAAWTAVYLTVAGVAVAAMSLVRSDRRALGWVGGALLAAASWVRLWDVGVETPEAYTLPSAVALLLVGLQHLRTHRSASTVTTLGSGLGLALVPSLLWALEDPAQPRSLWLGLGCLTLVAAGSRLRWTAPMLAGAAVGSVLVLRLAAPYVGDAVPRWVVIGVAGAMLIAMGVTWERRLREARQVMAYVRRLR
jgi:hypothetical protein